MEMREKAKMEEGEKEKLVEINKEQGGGEETYGSHKERRRRSIARKCVCVCVYRG